MIVVGVDTPVASAPALRWGAAEAALRHEPLRVVHVVPPVADLVSYGATEVAQRDAAFRRLSSYVDAVLGATPYVGTALVTETGYAPDVLLALAHDARMVVVGRPLRAFHPGRSGVVRTLLDRSPTTTAVVPQAATRPPGDRVVVGADTSPDGYVATLFAFVEAARRGASVHAIHALPLTSLVAAGVDSVGVVDAAVERATRQLREVVTAARRRVGFEVPYDAEVVLAPSGEALVAASRGAALLVTGTHPRSHVGRLLLGSTSRHCVEHADCPVAVVPLTRAGVPEAARILTGAAR